MIISRRCYLPVLVSFFGWVTILFTESFAQNVQSGIDAANNLDRSRQSHFSPPVHIRPGKSNGTAPQQVGSYPFTPKPGLPIMQPPERTQAKPGLQDRIEQALSKRQLGQRNQSADRESAQIRLASAQYPVADSTDLEELDLPDYNGYRRIEMTSNQQPVRVETRNGHDDRSGHEQSQPRSVLEDRSDQAFQEFTWDEGADHNRSVQRPSYRPANQNALPRPANFSRNNVQEPEFPPVNRGQDDEFEELGSGRGSLLDKPCDEFRKQLLGRPIQDIAMQLSPPPLARDRTRTDALNRDWRDRYDNLIATGSMVDLQRGYLILDGGQRIAYARLGEGELLAIAEYWNIPRSCVLEEQGSIYRDWVPQTYTWTASSLCHKPLYFENRQLERYGHTHGPIMQPVRSVAHFFVSLVTLPYQTAIHPPNECVYPLGLYRPGDCAPWLKDPIPISLSGISRQAMVTTGISVIPR